MAFAARCRRRSEQARDRPRSRCDRRADRGDSPPRGASRGQEDETGNEERERRHDGPVVEAVGYRIGGRKIAPLGRRRPRGLDESWGGSYGCQCEHRRLDAPPTREKRAPRRVKRDEDGRRDGDTGRERYVPSFLTRSTRERK